MIHAADAAETVIVAFVKELPPRFALGEHAIEPSEERTAASNSYVMPGSETRPTRRRVELSKHVTLGAGMSVRGRECECPARNLSWMTVDAVADACFRGERTEGLAEIEINKISAGGIRLKDIYRLKDSPLDDHSVLAMPLSKSR